MDFETPVVSSHWYAVYTKPKDEERADKNLMAWGVETFAPKIQERHYNQFTNAPSYLIKPLFPRYIFARFIASTLLRKIYYTRGVQSIVSLGDTPVVVDDDVIEMIQLRMNQDGFVNIEEELNINDKVMIKGGVLKNFAGIFDRRIKSTARIMILLTCITYQGRVSVEEQLVEKVS